MSRRMNFKKGELIGKLRTTDKTLTSVRSIRNEGRIRTLLANMKVLENEILSVQSDFDKRTDEMKRAEERLKKVSEEICHNHNELASTRVELRKQDKLNCLLLRKLELRNSENSILTKEINFVKQELKKEKADLTGTEIKLNKALARSEVIKGNSICSKQEIRGQRNSSVQKQKEISKELNILDQQNDELVIYFRKQGLLVGNLQKQKYVLNQAISADVPAGELLSFFDSSCGNFEKQMFENADILHDYNM